MSVGDVLTFNEIAATERFTQRPARYSEASLVRKLEELGIGRPSTYAPTISTIQNREYVEKGDKAGEERSFNSLTLKSNKISDVTKTEIAGNDKSKLFPTNIGVVVNDFLTEYFPDILDFNFTANVEKEFDNIADGEIEWTVALDNFYKSFHPVVEATAAVKTERKVGERIIGTDPKTGRQVAVKISRFGPVVQIGTAEEEEKPLFASLNKKFSMETITLEEALKHFELPRTLGDFEEKTVTVASGRFGPYVKHNNAFVSLPKGGDPMTISLEEAIVLIEEKRKKENEKLIKKFDEDPDIEVLNGRYGPYIAYKKKNFKIPKDKTPVELTFEECKEIIEKGK
jgi:DNA topoisomerase-1